MSGPELSPGAQPHVPDSGLDGNGRTAVIATGAVFAGNTLLCCVLKIYARIAVIKQVGLDDYLTAAATICALAYTGLNIAGALSVIVIPTGNNLPSAEEKYIPLLRALAYFYLVPTLLLSKLALAAFFYRLFSAVRVLVIAIWGVVVWASIVSFTTLFLSIGSDANKRMARPEDAFLPYLVAAAMNVVTDIMLLIIPLWGVLPLKMQLRRKIELTLIFLTGLSAVLASCLSLYYRHEQMIDATIIVACLPSVAVLFTDKCALLSTLRNSVKSIWQSLFYNRKTAIKSHSSTLNLEAHVDSKETLITSTGSSNSNVSTVTVPCGIYQMQESERGSVDMNRRQHIASFDSRSWQ